MSAPSRLDLRAGAALAVLALALAPGRATAGPLDPTDRARVDVIDAKIDTQLDLATDIQSSADEMFEVVEHAGVETVAQLGYFDANRRLDLERMMLRSCALACSKKPLPPANPQSASRCWTCVSPRLVLTRDHGGYLEDVLELVEASLTGATRQALPVDLVRAEAFLVLARAAFAEGDADGAFTHACQSFGTLACGGAGMADPPGLAARERQPQEGR